MVSGKVFLDESGIGAQGGLSTAIRTALERSRHWILVASPVAAGRPWIIRESRIWFDDLKRVDPPFILLAAGTLVWDTSTSDVDWTRTDALPLSMQGRLTEEPYIIDGRRFNDLSALDLRNPEFALAVAKLAAPLHGLEPGDLIGQDVREYRRTRIIAALAVTLILALGLAAGWWAVAERIARRDAQLRLADGQVFEAGVRLAQGDPISAEREFISALDGYRALGVPYLPASFGLFRLHLKTRFPLLSWRGHQGRAYAVAVAPDRCCVFSSGEDGAIRRFSLDQSESRDLLQPSGVAVRAFALSSDGSKVAAGFRDGSLLLWQDLNAQPVRLRDGGTGSPEAVALSSSALYGGGSDGAITVWPLAGGSAARYPVHQNRITSVQVAADGRTLLSGSIDNTAKVWVSGNPLELGAPSWSIPYPGPVMTVAIQPELPWVILAGADGLVHFWNVQTQKERSRPVHHGDPVFALAVDRAGQLGISGDIKGRAYLWDQATAAVLAQLVASRSTIFSASLTPDGELAATCDGDGQVYLWATTTPVRRRVGPEKTRPTALAISEDGLLVVGGDEQGQATIWDAVTGKVLSTLKVHDAPIRRVSICLSCRDIITSADDRTVVRMDMRTGAVLWHIVAPHSITTLGRDRRGRAVVGLADGSVIPEVPSSTDASLHGRPIVALSATEDGDVVSVNEGGAVSVGFRPLKVTGTGRQSPVTALAVSSRADTILLGHADGSLTVIAEQSKLIEISGDGSKIMSLKLADDGRTALAVSEAFDIALWNIAERRRLETEHLSVHPGFNSRLVLAASASASPAMVVFAGDAAPEVLDLAVAHRLSGRDQVGVTTLTDAERLAMHRLWSAANARLSTLSPTNPWLLNTAQLSGRTDLLRQIPVPVPGLPAQYIELISRSRSGRALP